MMDNEDEGWDYIFNKQGANQHSHPSKMIKITFLASNAFSFPSESQKYITNLSTFMQKKNT